MSDITTDKLAGLDRLAESIGQIGGELADALVDIRRTIGGLEVDVELADEERDEQAARFHALADAVCDHARGLRDLDELLRTLRDLGGGR